MKRPWSPGPWRFDRGFINPNQANRIYLIEPHESLANEKLASKAPEMAELLIALVKSCDRDDIVWELATRAEELLKELNYDPTMD